MDVKLNVCLLLLLVGALCVQGLRLRQESKNEPSFIKRAYDCEDADGQCKLGPCHEYPDYPFDCSEYTCPSGEHCCCPFP